MAQMTGRRGRAVVLATSVLVLALSVQGVVAEDWPQWRGVDRDAVWRDTGIVERFPDDGLVVKWRTPIRGGFAGPAVAGGRVFVLDYEETPGSRTMDGHERLLVLDEETGEVLWTREWPAAYRNIHFKFAIGPRATPTVDGDHVYILGAAGTLSCFEIATGNLVWRVETALDYGVTVPVFGVSQSPLVEGDHLIALLGGEPDAMVVAFDKTTGAEAWRAIETTSEPGYSSPIVITAGGVRQLIVWHAAAVTSLDPATGDVWWQHDFVVPSGLTIGTPVRSGRYLLVTQVENGGLMMALNSDRPAARPLWRGENPNRTDRPPQGATLSTPVVAGDAPVRPEQLRRVPRPRRRDRRPALVDRSPDPARAVGQLVPRAERRPLVRRQRERRARPRPLHAGRLRGDRPHAPADADHPHPRRRFRPLGRPGGPVVAPRVRQPARGGAERRRGGAPVARGRGLRVAGPRGRRVGRSCATAISAVSPVI